MIFLSSPGIQHLLSWSVIIQNLNWEETLEVYGLPTYILVINKKFCPADMKIFVPFLFNCFPLYLEFFNPTHIHWVSHIQSFIHLFAHPMFIESYCMTDSMPSTRDQRWAKIDGIHALMNLHLKVECGEKHSEIVMPITKMLVVP